MSDSKMLHESLSSKKAESANIAYKLMDRLSDAQAIGPILLGMGAPVHVLQRGVEVTDIVNMTALCVVDAQHNDV